MNHAFSKWTRTVSWPAIGWIKTLEVNRAKDGLAHPHFHVLLLVPPDYFSRTYLSQGDWTDCWQRVMQLSYKPIVHVRAVPYADVKAQIPELLKYQTKPQDLIADADWLADLTNQMDGLRVFNPGGVFRQHLAELEHEPTDLIGHDADDPIIFSDLSSEWYWQEEGYQRGFSIDGESVDFWEAAEYISHV